MPTAENKNDLKPDTNTPAAAAAEIVDGLPPWMTGFLEFLKKYQNVFYAIATVALLTWAVLKFQAKRKEEKLNTAEWEFSQAQSVDALRALRDKYAGLPIEPRIRFQIGNKLVEDEKLDEAIKEFDELAAKFPESLPGKLAGSQSKTAKENKEWNAKGGKLDQKLEELRKASADEKKPDPKNPLTAVKIDDKALPRVEFQTPLGNVLVELDEDDAPNATANLISLIEKTFYTKTWVYKVEKDSAVFFGDPMPDGSAPRGFTIPFESSKIPASGGVLALVRDLPAEGQPDSDDLKNTASTKLVIFTGEVPQYAGRYLVIGRVVEGMDFVRKLAEKDEIRSARVVVKRSHAYVPKENPKAPDKGPEPPKEPGK
ncbi:MAG: peptidylprolyl isomerase [Planctomycetes bacterium]|nr:peptidylprolyl isomerase [Planctomycetota bacterium]